MDSATIIGMVVLAIVSIGSFAILVVKFVQPITELKIEIQKLNSNFDSLKQANKHFDEKLEEHGNDIGDLKNRMGVVETEIKIYHGKRKGEQ